MDRMYGGHRTGTRPGALRLQDDFKKPGMCIDADLEHGSLFLIGKELKCSYPVAPGATAIELKLSLENIRDLRDELQAELDRRAGL